MREAIILAGGLGTRLQPVVKDLPKAMAPVNGRPFLEYLLNYLWSFGIARVVLSVGHRSKMIETHFGSEYNGIEIGYAVEKQPLGTGGGLRLAFEKCKNEHVLALNGDTLFQIDLKGFEIEYTKSDVVAAIALRKVQNVSRFGTVKIDKNHRITHFGEKTSEPVSGLINGGIYLLNRSFFLAQTIAGAFSVERDFFERIYLQGLIAGFVFDAWFIDIGIPEDYLRAQHEFKRFAD
jgi:D-glycero-alpha-D-manno-heptose 1-phosphate guanylyltransferase